MNFRIIAIKERMSATALLTPRCNRQRIKTASPPISPSRAQPRLARACDHALEVCTLFFHHLRALHATAATTTTVPSTALSGPRRRPLQYGSNCATTMATSTTTTAETDTPAVAHRSSRSLRTAPCCLEPPAATASFARFSAASTFSVTFSFDVCSPTEIFCGAGEVAREVLFAATADSTGAMALRTDERAANVRVAASEAITK